MTHMNRSQRQASGITLTELLVVISLIAVIAAIVIPTIGMLKDSAQRLKCLNNLRQLGMGSLYYRNDTKYFPPGDPGVNWPNEVSAVGALYLNDHYQIPYKTWFCPNTQNKVQFKNLAVIINGRAQIISENTARAAGGNQVTISPDYSWLVYGGPTTTTPASPIWIRRGRDRADFTLGGDLLRAAPDGNYGNHLGPNRTMSERYGANQVQIDGSARWVPGSSTKVYYTSAGGSKFQLDITNQ